MNEKFKNRMKELLKEEYPDFEKALLKEPVKALYLNENKKIPENFISNYNLDKHHFVDNGYYYNYKIHQLGKHPYHDCGLYYIQEPSAMIVASLLEIKDGMKVFDMCSAPGGKACFIASKLKQTGVVIANDITSTRASILSSNVERLGLANTIVTNCPPKNISNQLNDFFDIVVLDAPCSGEGMFRKLDQAIDTWSIEKVEECAAIQKELVVDAYNSLKPGGQLVYSTCTYSKEENEDIVTYILDKYPDMELVPISLQCGMKPGIGYNECCRLYPHHHQGEGHFIALFKKNGTVNQSKYKTIKSNITKLQKELLEVFFKDNLKMNIPTQVINYDNHLYAIKDDFPILEKVRILRCGLYLGECKKNRFEPSYALSHFLNPDSVIRSYNYDFDSKEVLDFLSGQTIEGSQKKGYGILFIDSLPLSFYKESNNTVKNLLPKGLRKNIK